jgi:methylmalonyl-CoA mutase N-terminal domain/subunit
LADFKKRRDPAKVAKALDTIRAVCQGKPVAYQAPEIAALAEKHILHATNVMPALIDGALANCTLGEMVQAMADIYGRYTGGPEW